MNKKFFKKKKVIKILDNNSQMNKKFTKKNY